MPLPCYISRISLPKRLSISTIQDPPGFGNASRSRGPPKFIHIHNHGTTQLDVAIKVSIILRVWNVRTRSLGQPALHDVGGGRSSSIVRPRKLTNTLEATYKVNCLLPSPKITNTHQPNHQSTQTQPTSIKMPLKAGDKFPAGVKFEYVSSGFQLRCSTQWFGFPQQVNLSNNGIVAGPPSSMTTPVSAVVLRSTTLPRSGRARRSSSSPYQVNHFTAEFARYNANQPRIIGAFTPSCSAYHLPPYVQKFKELKGKGVDIVAFIMSNDACTLPLIHLTRRHIANNSLQSSPQHGARPTRSLLVMSL